MHLTESKNNSNNHLNSRKNQLTTGPKSGNEPLQLNLHIWNFGHVRFFAYACMFDHRLVLAHGNLDATQNENEI